MAFERDGLFADRSGFDPAAVVPRAPFRHAGMFRVLAQMKQACTSAKPSSRTLIQKWRSAIHTCPGPAFSIRRVARARSLS